jgi:predicted transposase YdaD
MSTAIEEYKKSVKEEGREEGRQEGAEESRNEIATNMLMDHCAMETIEKYTQLPQEQIIQIAKANNIPLP